MSFTPSLTSFGGSFDDEGTNVDENPFEVRSRRHDEESDYTYDEDAVTEVQSSVYDTDDDESRYEGLNTSREQNISIALEGTVNYLFASPNYIPDATRQVHEVHSQLLELLSNPDEFKETLEGSADECSLLPYKVFAHDAEVVLPEALTASQLFGVEQTDGIELKAAVGMTQICQLFLRWLALMPGGDHCNIIYPPGLTIMRIAGGRYRVTAGHRVVWKWYNQFLPDPLTPEINARVEFGDLVSMTIVDVFETDLDGKLLSYCPTFDNRCLMKTNIALEKIRKSSTMLITTMGAVRQTSVGRSVEHVTNKATNMLFKYAGQAANTVVTRFQAPPAYVPRRRPSEGVPPRAPPAASTASSASMTLKEAIALSGNSPTSAAALQQFEFETNSLTQRRNPFYMSDDETTHATRETQSSHNLASI